jgi:hypothetical protein
MPVNGLYIILRIVYIIGYRFIHCRALNFAFISSLSLGNMVIRENLYENMWHVAFLLVQYYLLNVIYITSNFSVLYINYYAVKKLLIFVAYFSSINAWLLICCVLQHFSNFLRRFCNPRLVQIFVIYNWVHYIIYWKHKCYTRTQHSVMATEGNVCTRLLPCGHLANWLVALFLPQSSWKWNI